MLETAKEVFVTSPSRARILLIEDEPGMAQEISAELIQLGYAVEITDVPETALSVDVSLMVVDRMLHGKDSISVVQELRREGIQTPVLFMSALASVDERILGLKAGGDDYITKPFSMGELAARVEALLRRSKITRDTTLRVGPLRLDLIERRAWRADREISLLPREFKLLEYFMRHANQVVTRTMLLEDLWNYRFVPQTNLVDVHVGKVRRKVDGPDETALIQSVRGAGFMLHDPA